MTSLNIDLPASALTAGYDRDAAKDRYNRNKELIEDRYHYEKFIGKRKKNGALKLKDLTPVHRQIIACHVNGMKGVDIALQFKMAAITVYRILNDPQVQIYINEFEDAFKDEFRAMFPLVADAVREGLEHPNPAVKLKAVDRYVKVRRVLDGDGEDGSEDKKHSVVAARVKFVKLIKDAAKAIEGPDVIEAEAVLVETT